MLSFHNFLEVNSFQRKNIFNPVSIPINNDDIYRQLVNHINSQLDDESAKEFLSRFSRPSVSFKNVKEFLFGKLHNRLSKEDINLLEKMPNVYRQ